MVFRSVVVVGVAGLVVSMGGTSATSSVSPPSPTSGSMDSAVSIDYSQTGNWMRVPKKADKPVDVFYLYPTAYQKAATGPVISTIDDPGMRKGALAAYGRQATAFRPVANIYAPWYRQADAVVTLNLPPKQHRAMIRGVPTHDALRAFRYYLTHFNNGRPFILAAHSQGSEVTLNILTEYLSQRPKLLGRMVAAYVIGYSVTPKVLHAHPRLRFAEGARDTGVIVSYNTEAPVIGGPNPVVLPGSLAINPITWTRSNKKAPAKLSKGSWLPDRNGVFHKVMDFADARVNLKRGVLIAARPDVDELAPGNVLFPKGVYHSYDYPFYYFNLRANARSRMTAFLGGT